MKRFYKLAEGDKPKNEFELENLGLQITDKRLVNHGAGILGMENYTRQTTSQDYDKIFLRLLYSATPVFKSINLLDYHFDYYEGDKKEFLTQIKYIILPIVKKEKPDYFRLISDWINNKESKSLPPNTIMPKNFEIERREAFGEPYLKLFLRSELDHQSVAIHLQSLHSVRRANVTDQKSGKKDLTIYPAKAYDISEAEQEIILTLNNYFQGNSIDPSFSTETIPSLSDKAYFQIIDYIILLGKNLEAFKELNTKFDEERYRDYFIPFLNAVSKQHSAKGEVFNKKGKTDILVFDNEGNNIFIAECKLWKGEVYLIAAINQLFENYVNWRDEKTAIIIFNRDVKKFSEVIDKATSAVTTHPLCLKSIGQRKSTSYSYLFRHSDEKNRIIKLELLLLNFA